MVVGAPFDDDKNPNNSGSAYIFNYNGTNWLEETELFASDGEPDDEFGCAVAISGDTLVVWKLDRLARSLRQLVETVEDLEAQQIGFKSLTETIDTTTSGGKLIFHIFAALAEFERSIIRERTQAGLASAKARGRIGGRPRSLSDKDITAAKAMLSDVSISVEEVAQHLGVSPSTLYRHIPGGRSSLSG